MHKDNGITVKQLMNAPMMRQSTLLAGASGLGNVIVRANTYADDDIFNWVMPGELLLVTWLSFKDKTMEEMIAFVERAVSLGVAALAVKPSLPEHEVPKAIVRHCNKLKLPLIQIDLVSSIADVASEVFNQIFQLQARLLRKHEDVYDRLMTTLADGGGLRDVLAIASSATGLPTAFAHADKADPIVVVSERSRLNEALKDDVRTLYPIQGWRERWLESQTTIQGEDIDRLVVPVMAKRQLQGVLVLWGLDRALTPFDRAAVESVAVAAALVIVQDKALREIEIKHSAEFVADLLSEANRNDALERARLYKLDRDDTYQVVIVRLRASEMEANDDEEAERPREGIRTGDHRLHDFIHDHLRWVAATLQCQGLRGLVTTRRSDVLALVAVTESDHDAKLASFCDSVARQLSTVAGGSVSFDLRIGVGQAYAKLANIGRSYADADKTLVVGTRLFDHTVLRFSDLGVFRILVQGEVNEELERYFTETLRPLLDYDKRKSTDLVRTLESYFKHNSNINKTSEELFTHYNTILYRLERIQDITQLDLNDANDRLNLELAMRLRSLFCDSRD